MEKRGEAVQFIPRNSTLVTADPKRNTFFSLFLNKALRRDQQKMLLQLAFSI